MKDVWIAPARIFDGQTVLTGHAVRVIDDKVVDLAPAPETAVSVTGCLTPGFVDLQVNGGGGFMLNATPTRAAMAAIASAHRQFGTVAILPTVITDTAEVLDRAADAAIAARLDDGIAGLHIEGPHISKARRGTHHGALIRDLDTRTMDVVARLRHHGVAVMITVAPEAATHTQISALASLGAVVSIGHTDAPAEVVEAAIAAGASCATHLFNAMSPMTARAPGAVGAIINSQLHSGIICDGYHVDDRMIRLALRARPADNLMFLVSDAMATVGGPDRFDLYGRQIRLEGGRLVNAEGNLAGAHVTQAGAVARLVHDIGMPLDGALRMAVTVPARVIGKDDLAQLTDRLTRDLLLLPDDLIGALSFADALATRAMPDAAG